jgi:hypothetical protein
VGDFLLDVVVMVVVDLTTMANPSRLANTVDLQGGQDVDCQAILLVGSWGLEKVRLEPQSPWWLQRFDHIV